jgi:lipid-A-disaccharide synthase-like uncharacterized protein
MNASDTLQTLKVIPYTATSLSVLGRFIFMFLLYKNKSTNSLSLLFCFLSIISSSMWIYYSVQMNDAPLVMRSSTEITLLFLSALYIIKNKVVHHREMRQIHPLPEPPPNA